MSTAKGRIDIDEGLHAQQRHRRIGIHMNANRRRAASVIVFLGLWELVVRLGLVPSFLLSAPSQVAVAMFEMLRDGTLIANIDASMTRVLAGYALALVVGVGLGAIMGWFRWIDDFVDPIIELFRPVSPLAILPLSILWLGIGEASKIFVVFYGCIFPILLNTYAGVRSVPKSSVEAALTMGASPGEMMRHVVLFHSLPMIMTGARISFAVGMIVIIASEMVAASQGLGYMILTAQQTFNTIELYVGIVTIAVIGFAGDRVLRFLRKKLCPWHLEVETSTVVPTRAKMRNV